MTGRGPSRHSDYLPSLRGERTVRPRGSALDPRKSGDLPAAHGSPVPCRVVRTLEPVRNVVAPAVTHRRHRLRCMQAPDSRTAYEEDRRIWSGVQSGQLGPELFNEGGVLLPSREGLPFDQDRLLPKRRQIGQTNIRPLCSRTDINENGVGFFLKPSPDLPDVDILYSSSFF
jgi:hypothetical protein